MYAPTPQNGRTLKQLVGNLPTNCLSVFDHFVGLALKGLRKENLELKAAKPLTNFSYENILKEQLFEGLIGSLKTSLDTYFWRRVSCTTIHIIKQFSQQLFVRR